MNGVSRTLGRRTLTPGQRRDYNRSYMQRWRERHPEAAREANQRLTLARKRNGSRAQNCRDCGGREAVRRVPRLAPTPGGFREVSVPYCRTCR